MSNFNPNSFWNNVLVQNETDEKYSNVQSLAKPIESILQRQKYCRLVILCTQS